MQTAAAAAELVAAADIAVDMDAALVPDASWDRHLLQVLVSWQVAPVPHGQVVGLVARTWQVRRVDMQAGEVRVAGDFGSRSTNK